MTIAPEHEAEYSDLFRRVNERWCLIGSFRQFSSSGLSAALKDASKVNQQFLQQLTSDTDWADIFKDKSSFMERLEPIGGVNGLSKLIVGKQADDYLSAIDAASLIFAHSVIDEAVFDYCRLAADAFPNDWIRYIKERKVSIKELVGSSSSTVIQKKVAEYALSLNMESLPRKVDILFAVCKPPKDWAIFENGEIFDMKRLKKLDRLRHAIVHGRSKAKRLPKGDDDILFLRKVAYVAMGLLNFKYNFRLDTKRALIPPTTP